ncbi:MAG: hypothetical protein IIZ39_00025, partial [Blautia sp.]|nr:hypothetical protein [Blautia sp.]
LSSFEEELVQADLGDFTDFIVAAEDPYASYSYLQVGVPQKVNYTGEEMSGTFLFRPTETGIYRISSQSEDENDPVLSFCDESGQEIDRADDYEDSVDFLLHVSLEADKTYVCKTWNYSQEDGEYEILVEQMAPVSSYSFHLKEGYEIPFYGLYANGTWAPEGDGTYSYEPSASAFAEMFLLEVTWADGKQLTLDGKDLSAETVEGSSWGIDKENLLLLTYEGETFQISVPFRSFQDVLPSLPSLTLGQDGEARNGEENSYTLFTFTPEKSGFYRVQASGPEYLYPYVDVYDAIDNRLLWGTKEEAEEREYLFTFFLEAERPYVLYAREADDTEVPFLVKVEEGHGVEHLEARLKDPKARLVYGISRYGVWKEDKEGKEFFSFDEENVEALFALEAVYDDGTREQVEEGEASLLYLTPQEWAPGGENKARFQYKGGSCDVSVPIISWQDALAICPELTSGNTLSVNEEEEAFALGMFLFRAARDGYVRFTLESKYDQRIRIYDGETLQELDGYRTYQSSTSLSVKIELKAGKTYVLVAPWEDAPIYQLTATEEKKILAMEATPRTQRAALVCGRGDQRFVDVEDEQEDDVYYFDVYQIARMFTYEAVLEDGSRKKIEVGKIEDRKASPSYTEEAGGEVLFSFSYEEAEGRVSLPVISAREAYASCSQIRQGETAEVSYEPGDVTSGVFLFTP